MAVALLDVNVLIALAWPNHVHHNTAHRWFRDRGMTGWATTPVTELGFVRVSSNKKILPEAATPGTALQVLRALCDLDGHRFWPDDSRLVEPPFSLDRLGSHKQLTNLHLAALATRHEGTLSTFDQGVARSLGPAHRNVIELLPTT